MLNKVINTTNMLVKAPRNVIDGFIYTNNPKFTHPFFYLITGIVVVIVLNTIFVDFSPNSLFVTQEGTEQQSIEQINEWIEVVTFRMSTQFLPLSLLVLIPLLSVAGVFFFRESTDGFYSNLILNSYSVGVANALLLLLIPGWKLFGPPSLHPFFSVIVPALIIGMVLLWIYYNYFTINNILDWIRVFSSIISGFIMYYFLIGFLAGVIGYMFFAINRIVELSGGV